MTSSLAVRHVALRVANLAPSLDFYTRQVGFVVTRQDQTLAELAVSNHSPPILTLLEDANAAPAPHTAAGLFHTALLFPNREVLGAWLRGAAGRGVEFDGFSDHAVSEAIYFTDHDGNGLEFYVDRARTVWPFANGEVQMVTRPLDLPSLLSAAKPSGTAPLEGAAWGHVHLRVTDLDRSERFYCDQLGMSVTQRSYPGARFLAADGYHHHVGLNIWGRARDPQPDGALGLAWVTFARAGTGSATELRDPDRMMIRIDPL
jgi:catechol 2,3-dioxygenase